MKKYKSKKVQKLKSLGFALLLLYFCTFLPSPSEALIARGVGPATSTTTPGTACTMTLNGTTAGRMLVISVGWWESGGGGPFTISSVTVSGESAATIVAGSKVSDPTNANTGQIAYLANITSGGNKTVTVNFSGSTYIGCGVMEYSGQDTASQPDTSTTQSNNDGTGATTCNSTITTAANSLIVAICWNNNVNAVTAGSTYTLWTGFPSTGSGYQKTEDKVDAGTAGSEAVLFAGGPYQGAFMSVVSFKVASGGGGGPAPNATVRRRVQ